MASGKIEISEYKEKKSWKNLLKTGALVFSWIVMGMYAEISGPTLIDLKLRLQTGYEDLATALSARGVGTFPGCIIGGFLIDKFSIYSHFILALTLDIAAVAVFFMPWVSDVDYIWLLCFISGFVQSIHNTAGTRIILDIWKDKSASPIILMHLGYGIGSFLAPLYADPFLAEKIDNSTKINEILLLGSVDEARTIMNTNSTAISLNTSNLQESSNDFTESRIEYAYAISSIATASMSVPFFIFQLLDNKLVKQLEAKDIDGSLKDQKKYEKNVSGYVGKQENDLKTETKGSYHTKFKSLLKLVNPASCAKGRFWYGFSIIFLMFFYFGNAGGGQGLISNFVRSFSIDQLHFSKSDGSLVNTSFWISFSIGRFSFFILAKWVSVKVLIIIETCCGMISAILMAIFADDNSLALWVLIQPIGFFYGPLWPTGVAWTDFHMELTGMGMASQMIGAAVGHIFHMRLIGYLYENFGPLTYLYHVAGSMIFGFILAVTLDIVGARHGSRFALSDDEHTDANINKFQIKEDEIIYTTKL